MNELIHSEYLIEATYLAATALFILSLKWMSSPTTARRGVWAGELGMLLAIIGWINLASTVPYHASQMYARNLTAFLLHLVKEGRVRMDQDDEIIRETLLTRDGEIVNNRVREFFELPPVAAPQGAPT